MTFCEADETQRDHVSVKHCRVVQRSKEVGRARTAVSIYGSSEEEFLSKCVTKELKINKKQKDNQPFVSLTCFGTMTHRLTRDMKCCCVAFQTSPFSSALRSYYLVYYCAAEKKGPILCRADFDRYLCIQLFLKDSNPELYQL